MTEDKKEKLTIFSALAMNAILSTSVTHSWSPKILAEKSIAFATELLNQLDEIKVTEYD